MNDTIYRQEAIDAVYETMRQIGYEHNTSMRSIIQAIGDLPSTQSERKSGHWEKPQRHGVITYDEHAYAECSCCHVPQYLARGMNYCPNCGAEMEKENE